MNNLHYDNQKLYCATNNVPMFTYSSCNHTYGWIRDDRYGNLQTLSEMLIEKHGHEEAFVISSSTHIISCPICNRSWCD